MDNEYLQSLYTPEQQLLLFGDANYFNNQDPNSLPFSIADLAAKNANLDFFPAPQDFYTSPTYIQKQQLGYDFPTGITSSSVAKDMTSIPYGTSVDNFQGFTDKVDFSKPKEPSGIEKLIKFLMPGNMLSQFLPKSSPETKFMKNFYGNQFGLTPTGQVASGIMQGYNPVYGGFINKLTGGKLGEPTKYGLQDAYQKRIDRIKKTLQNKYIDKGISLDETELDERLATLEQLKLDELNAFKAFMDSKAPQPEGLKDVGTGGETTTSKVTTGAGDDKPSPMQIKASKSPKVGVSGYTAKDDVRESRRGKYF